MNAGERISSNGGPRGVRRSYLALAAVSLLVGAGATLLLHLGGENVYHAVLKGACSAGAALTGLVGLWEFHFKSTYRKIGGGDCCDRPQ